LSALLTSTRKYGLVSPYLGGTSVEVFCFGVLGFIRFRLTLFVSIVHPKHTK
jgi:hypothetical protein